MTVEAPPPGSITLHDALFSIGASDPARSRRTLEDLRVRVRYALRGEPHPVEITAERVVVILGPVELGIEPPVGLALTVALGGKDPTQEHQYLAYGSEFMSFCEEVDKVSYEGFDDAAKATVKRLSDKIWVELRRIFGNVLEGGDWTIVARVNSQIADFEAIPWDAFRNLQVDWNKGVAEASNGARLYSLHVAPKLSLRPRVERKKSITPQRDLASQAIKALWPSGHPSGLRNKALVAEVHRWCEREDKPKLSEDTILRAAGRRRD